MSGFGLVTVAVNDYPDPPGRLPSSESADRFGAIVVAGGGVVLNSVVATGEQELVDTIRSWATDLERPTASLVYLVGHGRGDGLDHEFLLPAWPEVVPLRTARLAEFLQRDWQSRQTDPASWTLFILDCCDSELGITNLMHELVAKYPKRPRRLGLWPVAPGGASRAGAFVDAFARAIEAYPENSTRIPLTDIFQRIRRELGDVEPDGFLPDNAVLVRSGPARPLVMPLDVHARLRRAIADRPPEFRSHFLAKALGGEVSELAWQFIGREDETRDLCSWLRDGSGLRVVTGEPGSGKSALLGHLVVLADPELVDLYIESGLAPHLTAAPRPPDHVFSAVVHLTGKTALDTVHEFATQLGIGSLTEVGNGRDRPAIVGDLRTSIDALVDGVRAQQRHAVTVLVDALDESQEPIATARLLHDLAVATRLRVLVGTRRSLSEGPDQPTAPTGDHELLDALRVDGADVLVVERDPAAVFGYAVQRLRGERSPYADRVDVAGALAGRIAALNQPFLFARLATAELLVRPAMELADPALSRLLEHGHQGVFAGALDRISTTDSGALDIVHTLAYARGRGMPRTGGTWLDAARVVGGKTGLTDASIDAAMALAAPYITLDGEAGQSTYRLAHQTFVEYFRAQPGHGECHRRIAGAFAERFRGDPEGWGVAGYYPVRYLPEHLVADAERGPLPLDRLTDLVTDAGWLLAAVGLLGADRTVEVIVAARQQAALYPEQPVGPDAWTGQPNASVLDAVERTLRRSRTVLAGDPGQLPGQFHARLKDEPTPALAALGDRVGQITGHPWLRMIQGRMDWWADLDTTYRSAGKVRALGFGLVDERPVVAIAINNRIELWDPRQGEPDRAAAIDLGDHRATAVAMAVIDGRPVVVTNAAYDGVVELWDARTGARLAEARGGNWHTLAVGRLGDRLVVAGLPPFGAAGFLDARTLRPTGTSTQLRHRDVRGFAVYEGRLVALVHLAPDPDRPGRIAAVDPVDGAVRWRSAALDEPRTAIVTGAHVGAAFVVVGTLGSRPDLMFWLTEDHLHTHAPAHSVLVRALALGAIGGRLVVISAPDHDDVALVELREARREMVADGAAALLPGPSEVGWSSSIFDDVPDSADLAARLRSAGSRPEPSFTVEHPERWPVTTVARGTLDDRPVMVGGSIEGSAWVWDTAGEIPQVVAGPFATVQPDILERGSEVFGVKPSPAVADAVALGHHPDHGPIVAVASSGEVQLYTVPAGEPVRSPAVDASVVVAVDLGVLNGCGVLVTGSKNGALAVWDLSSCRRLAILTLDAPIADVRVVASADRAGRIAVRTGWHSGDFILELARQA